MQAFDTLKLSQDLEKVFPPDQAKVLSTVLFEYVTGDLATRHDIDGLARRLDSDISGIKVDISRLRADISSLKADVGDLQKEITRLDAKIDTQGASIRAEIKDAKLDLIKWGVGALVLNFAGNAGLIITLIHNVRP